MCRILHFVLLLLLATAVGTRAQGHDSQGREFWVAFLENVGSGGLFETSDLRLYAACTQPTTIRVAYHATGVTKEFAIPVANRPVEIDITALFGADVEITGAERRSRKSFIVTSDEEITLYGVNVRRMSADAFLALPADVLTRRYVVLAYQNGLITSPQGFTEVDQPSQFCVIATEDGTTLRVEPSGAIEGKPYAPFTVGLDRGEVYFAQARLDGEWDLTGTTILSTKPVAVFAGNRRTAIPAAIGNFRDHLVEQMPPVEVWGKEAIVTPHYPIAPASKEIAIVRVVSATDDTKWSIDGVEQTPLQRASAVDLPLTRAMRIVAERPILVAQYEHSVNATDTASEQFELGDPFMMVIPPPEQFDTVYAFQSVAHQEFLRHFVNVVIPREGLPSLRLDGRAVTAPFVHVPGTPYGYLQVELAAGAHTIRSDSAFGLYAYGYGRANSYGYTGGMAFRRLAHDYQAPELEQSVACGVATGIFLDDRITDSGIDSMHALPQQKNVRLTITPFTSGADSVLYRAELIDPYSDGIVAVRAVDSSGRSRTQVTPIPGFTVAAAGMRRGAPVELEPIVLYNAATDCRSFEVVNEGAFTQTIADIRFTAASVETTLKTAMPIVLEPGERRAVEFCVRPLADTVARISVALLSSCVERTVVAVDMIARVDTVGPAPSIEGEGCGSDVILRFSEAEQNGSGIIGLEWGETVNCAVVSMSPATLVAAVGRVEALVRIADPRRDAFIAGTVRDRAGNRRSFRDTIAGFTCAVIDEASDTLSLAAGRDWRTERMRDPGGSCDSITLVNYGVRPIEITAASLDVNEQLSIPPSQLPLMLAPGERRRIAICYHSTTGGLADDTLNILDVCGRLERVALHAGMPAFTARGADHCNNALSVQSLGPAKRTFLMPPVPNPSRGATATIDVGLVTDAPVSLELFDANGRPALTVIRSEPLGAGLHRIVADLTALESGCYYVRMRADGADVVQSLVVAR